MRQACFGDHVFRNMIRASKLKGIDPEMAAFRALTAEEEAASALIHSLKWHRYKLSEQLKPRDHIQKAAVYPFFLAVEGLLARGVPREADPQLEIDESRNVAGNRYLRLPCLLLR